MREKNIKRAAHALYLSQGDDKNKLLAKRISDPDVEELVKDQGRVLVVLEKLILPKGKDSYTQEEMEELLFRKLKKKGHRIQGDEEEDDAQYAEEKRRAMEARAAEVPSLLGMNLTEVLAKEVSEEKAEKVETEELKVLLDSAFDTPSPVAQVATVPQYSQSLLLTFTGAVGVGLAVYAWLSR